MTRSLLFIAALAAIALPVQAADGNVDSAIAAYNAQVQTATKNYDAAALARLISNDYTLIGGDGKIWNRDAFLRDVADRSTVWELNEPENVIVRSYNGDCALVIAILHMRYRTAGKLHDLRVRYTDVWVKLDGTWRYVTGQATPPLKDD